MSTDEGQSIKDTIYEVIEVSLAAQLRAIRRLRESGDAKVISIPKEGMSQVDMAYDVLVKAGTALHVNDIIRDIETTHKIHVDRESLVSALTKKVARGKQFSKAGKNTFAALAK